MRAFLLCLLLNFPAFAQSTQSEAIGSYNKGQLLNGVGLPAQGYGYMRLFLEQDRGYGTSDMINMLVQSAGEMIRTYPNKGRLQVEDISARYGGKIKGHGSHQNGLDVDITYYRQDGREHVPYAHGRQYGLPMVQGNSVSPWFDRERTWQLLKTLHRNGQVQRIFMDKVLKDELCRYSNSINDFDVEVLRSIRHADNHQDHMHVRLRCPVSDKRCTPQGEVPPGHGCFEHFIESNGEHLSEL